ncbi:hypothetical protein N0V95_009950 [Ascochyta clinopodiicola]|nr:hypothetical protein N0V95_009950 [Ascochyta clinopodiicola]
MSSPFSSSGIGHGRPTFTAPEHHVNNFASAGPSNDYVQDPRLHHETSYGQYMPAAQFGHDPDYQPYVPENDMGGAWNAGSASFGSSSDDAFARLFDAPGATASVPASVVNGTQHETAASSTAFDISSGSASSAPAHSGVDAGQLNFGPWSSTPLNHGLGQDVAPHVPFNNSGADISSAAHAVRSKREPFHKLFAGEDPLCWARSAFQLGLAPPPCQCSVQFGGQSLDFWLPTQKEFDEWDIADAFYLMQRCEALRIQVNWQALDSYGFPVRPLEGFAQMGRFNHRPAAQGPPPPASMHGPAGDPSPIQGFQAPLMRFPQPPAPKMVYQQHLMVQQNYQHAQASPSDHGFPQVVPPRGVSNDPSQSQDVTHRSPAMQAARPQQPQPVPAPQQKEKRRARRRKVHDANAMMQPSADARKAAGAAIELPTADDRRQHQRGLKMAWWDPQVDNSAVPETDETQRPYVKTLKEAMLDTSQAKDSQEPNTSFTKRWSAAALASNGYPRTTGEMEATCWDLIEMTVKLHKDGPGFLKVHDQRLQDKLEAEQDLTFQQRIDTMVTVMLLSKARVDKLLKHENLGSFVGHPTDILRSTLGNRGHNDRRKDQNQRGKRAQKEDAERAAAAAAAAAAGTADGTQAGEEVGKVEAVEQAEEEEDEDEDGDADGAGSRRKDDDDDDDDDDNGGSGMAARKPPTTNKRVARADTSPSTRQSDAGNDSGRSKHRPSTARSHRTGIQPPSSSRLSTLGRKHTPRPYSRPSPHHPHPSPPSQPNTLKRRSPDLSQPSPPKRLRSASYTASADEITYEAPRSSPGPSSPRKRRSAEAELEDPDTDTRRKSARSVDRRIVAPRRGRGRGAL